MTETRWRTSLLQGLDPDREVMQSQTVSPKYVYIKTTINELSRLYLCVHVCMCVCVCITTVIKEGFMNLKGSWGVTGVGKGECGVEMM